METTSGLPGDSQPQKPAPPAAKAFRDTVPAYVAPDRAEWQAKHGRAPYELKDVPEKYLSRAAAAVDRDAATIGFDQAIRAHTAVDEVNEAVHVYVSAMTLGDYLFAHVFYDPTTKSFWAYPIDPNE